LDAHYVAGVVDGEGSFYTSARKRKDYKSSWRFSVTLNVAQNDKKLLQFCKQTLNCGTIRQTSPSLEERKKLEEQTACQDTLIQKEKFIYEVTTLSDLQNKVIPFFKTYPFRSTKKAYELQIVEQLVNWLIQLDRPIQTKDEVKIFLEYRKRLGKYRKVKVDNSDEKILADF
jgi:hypothetical protein